MGDASIEKGQIIHADAAGVVGEHPEVAPRPFFAAPTLDDDLNALALDLVPIACLNVGDVLFEFDSSVPREDAGLLLAQLPELRRKRASAAGLLPPIGIFGHTDPSGNDEYNKTLAGRRANAIHALLIHDAKAWDKLFATPFGGDDWSKKMDLKTIAKKVGLPPTTSRVALFTAFMKAIVPEPLQKADFLGRGEDAGGKADFQGCGEFNPLLLLSASDLKTLPKDSRDAANLIDRRVAVFLFRPGLKVSVKDWPCPRASEGTGGCRKRFFRDAKQRLTPGPERKRHFGPADETFACRFYDRIAGASPCEQFLRMYKIRLFDTFATPLPLARFTVTDGKRTVTGITDDDAFATIRDLKVPAEIQVRWTHPKDETQEFFLNIHVDVEGDDDDAAKRRLHNLGFERFPTLADNVRDFQNDHAKRFPAMTATGVLDAPTRAALAEVHEDCEPTERPRGQ
jgi:hypothetical protein